MTLIHKNAQKNIKALVSTGFFQWADTEFYLNIPDHPLRASLVRSLDVSARCDIGSGVLGLGIEVQHSATNLGREERRIRDINLTGLPVLFVVTAENVVAVSGTKARVPAWVQDWAMRHGRRQLAVIEADGQLNWLWFAQNQAVTPKCDIVARAKITPGMDSVCGNYTLSLCVDDTRPAAKGSPSLLIAAFAWIPKAPKNWRKWPPQALAGAPIWQPTWFPQPVYLGSSRARAMFPANAMSFGGF